MKFQINPRIKADHVTAFNTVYKKGEIYDSAERRIPGKVMREILGLKLKGIPFFKEVKS